MLIMTTGKPEADVYLKKIPVMGEADTIAYYNSKQKYRSFS